MVIEKYGDDNFHNEARAIRYRYFESLVEKYNANYLMTAHHGDDLVETILMRLTRGSTLKGYGGFYQEVDKGTYKIIRPLVYATKQEIEEYDHKHDIPYVIDSSNKKDKYTRNRYRKVVLPFLKNEDSKVHEKFLKFSQIINEYDEYIDKQAKKALSKVYTNNTLSISKYLELELLLQDKVLYNLLENIYHDDLFLLNDKHINLVKKLISSSSEVL
jgi:tRNA(Ile)-lysidine synthase